MASGAGQRQAGKDASSRVKDIVNADPEFYDQGSEKLKDDRPRVTGKAPPQDDTIDPQDEADAKALENDKDARAADKDADLGDPDAEAIDKAPVGEYKEGVGQLS